MAAKNKCLAQSNKSSGRAETTKGATNRVPPMSNILKSIDLTDHAIRRVVFAVLDQLAAEHRTLSTARRSVDLPALSVGNSSPNRCNDDAS
jgi:hypothetical protein